MSSALESSIKRNDTSPAFAAILRDKDGEPINLSGVTKVRFLMRDTRTKRVKVDALGIVVGDPKLGRVQYNWATGDTDTAGAFDVEFEVTFGTGEIETFPNSGTFRLNVLPDVA